MQRLAAANDHWHIAGAQGNLAHCSTDGSGRKSVLRTGLASLHQPACQWREQHDRPPNMSVLAVEQEDDAAAGAMSERSAVSDFGGGGCSDSDRAGPSCVHTPPTPSPTHRRPRACRGSIVQCDPH